jgi:hypothetical protein
VPFYEGHNPKIVHKVQIIPNTPQKFGTVSGIPFSGIFWSEFRRSLLNDFRNFPQNITVLSGGEKKEKRFLCYPGKMGARKSPKPARAISKSRKYQRLNKPHTRSALRILYAFTHTFVHAVRSTVHLYGLTVASCFFKIEKWRAWQCDSSFRIKYFFFSVL